MNNPYTVLVVVLVMIGVTRLLQDKALKVYSWWPGLPTLKTNPA